MDKRITFRHEDGSLPAPWDLNWEEVMEKLAYFEDAEEEGRLIVLPRKPERLNLHRAAELILADEEGRVMIWDAPMESPEPKKSGTASEVPADKRRRKK